MRSRVAGRTAPPRPEHRDPGEDRSAVASVRLDEDDVAGLAGRTAGTTNEREPECEHPEARCDTDHRGTHAEHDRTAPEEHASRRHVERHAPDRLGRRLDVVADRPQRADRRVRQAKLRVNDRHEDAERALEQRVGETYGVGQRGSTPRKDGYSRERQVSFSV